MNNSCSAATWPVDAQPLTAWEKGMSNPSRQQLQTPVKCFPLLASIQKWLSHPALDLSSFLYPIRTAFLSYQSLQNSVQASQAFLVLCWLFLQFIDCILHLPASWRVAFGSSHASISFCQPAPNANRWLVLWKLPAGLGVGTVHREEKLSLFLPAPSLNLPSKQVCFQISKENSSASSGLRIKGNPTTRVLWPHHFQERCYIYPLE